MDVFLRSFRWNTLIEPVTFFTALSFGLSEIVLTDEILLKTCENAFEGTNISDCSSLRSSSSSISLLEIVQPRATTLLALKSWIDNLLPALVLIFLGSWSDVVGRKPLLVIAATGTTIYYATLALLSYFNVDIYWYLAASFIASIFGGFPAVIVASYSYAADIADLNAQFHRLHCVDLSVLLGKIVGCLAYPAIVKQFGYSATFAISAFGCVLGLIFACILLNATVPEDDRDAPDDFAVDSGLRKTISLALKFFDFMLDNPFTLIWFALFAVMLHDDNVQGTLTTLFLFTQQLQWTLSDFSIYTAVHFVIIALGMILLSFKFLTSRIPNKEVWLPNFGILVSMGCALTRVFATTSTHVYVAMFVGAFSWLPMYLTRDLLIESTARRNYGKGFAAMTVLERVALSFVIPLNVYLCTNFITTYPHPVWFTQVSLVILAFLLYTLACIVTVAFLIGQGDD